MKVGYFNKNTLNARIAYSGTGYAFTLWETVDGKIVPVTVKDTKHNSFASDKGLVEMGELKNEILRMDIQTAVKSFGKNADEILQSLNGYKNAVELLEYIQI